MEPPIESGQARQEHRLNRINKSFKQVKMDREFRISYLAIGQATENGNVVTKEEEFYNEIPIESRKESIKWLQNECIDFVKRNGKNENVLEIRLLFKTGIELDRLIVAAKIENGKMTHADSTFSLDGIFQNLIYEYDTYSRNNLDTGGMIRMAAYKNYGPVLGIYIRIDSSFIFDF